MTESYSSDLDSDNDCTTLLLMNQDNIRKGKQSQPIADIRTADALLPEDILPPEPDHHFSEVVNEIYISIADMKE